MIEECHYKPITSAQSPNTDEEPQYEETVRRGCRLDWYAPILLLLSQNVNVKMRLCGWYPQSYCEHVCTVLLFPLHPTDTINE